MESMQVKAKYEYEYISGDGVKSKMLPGDVFKLVKKSNNDWWYVQKDGDRKGVYLPASYLEEIKKAISVTRTPLHILPNALLNHEQEPVPKSRQDGSSAFSREMEERLKNNVFVSVANNPEIPDPDYENFKGDASRPSRLDINLIRKGFNSSGRHSPHSPMSSNTPGTSSSSSMLSPGFPSSHPSTGPAKDTPPGVWEVHTDDKGRRYFYNSSTNETTWTPPRPLTPTSPQTSSNTSPVLSSKLPYGWKEETTTNGETVYVHDDSSEKWYSSKNSKGEVYYYSANREHTTWELPPVTSRNFPPVIKRQHSEDENQQSQLRAGLRNSRGEGQQRPTTVYGTGTFGGPIVSNQRPNFPTDSQLMLNVRRRYSDLDGNELSPEAMAREKEGILNRAKLDDGRKPTKLKFVSLYAVLTGSTLVFYKDQKIAERAGSPLGTPEYSTDLWGAEVDLPKARQGKKTTFELRESSGQALLLLAESDKETSSWHEAIRGAIKALGPAQNRYQQKFSPEEEEFMFTHSGQGAQGSRKSGENIRDSVNRNLMGGERKPFISRQLRPKSVLLMTGRNDKPNGDFVAIKERNKIKNKLKSFISRRPTIEALQKQGIIREENVFGKQLAHLCERERTVVPRFVKQCIEAIDKRGLQVDGIYRVSGNLSLIQKLRFQIDQEKPVDFDVSPYKEDIHVITGSLKLYFRELPEPLLTFAAYDPLMAAIRLPDKTIKQNIFREILKQLPRVNFETLKFLLEHLSRIVANCKHNRMSAQSVAIVFGPTLMWSKKEAFNIAMNMVQQNQCIEFILNEHASIL